MAEYTLPDLDYDDSAAEPRISGQINEFRHSRHFCTAVNRQDGQNRFAGATADSDRIASV